MPEADLKELLLLRQHRDEGPFGLRAHKQGHVEPDNVLIGRRGYALIRAVEPLNVGLGHAHGHKAVGSVRGQVSLGPGIGRT